MELRTASRCFVSDESNGGTSVNSNLPFMRLCCQGMCRRKKGF
jgi:hypothetical protein